MNIILKNALLNKILRRLNNYKIESKILISSIIIICFISYPYIFFSPLTGAYISNITSTILEDYLPNFLRILLCCFVLLLLYGMFFHNKFAKLKFLNLFLKGFFNIRPLVIFLFAILEVLLLFTFEEDIREYISKLENLNASKWLGPVIALLIAAPIAFFLWMFRNEDKKADLRHADENIRQSDFHKIEEWATTFNNLQNQFLNNDTEYIRTDVNALQIAAIYQLVPFLKGEYGERFIRPSKEICNSLLAPMKFNLERLQLIKFT